MSDRPVVALVTGADRALGQEVAWQFAERGAARGCRLCKSSPWLSLLRSLRQSGLDSSVKRKVTVLSGACSVIVPCPICHQLTLKGKAFLEQARCDVVHPSTLFPISKGAPLRCWRHRFGRAFGGRSPPRLLPFSAALGGARLIAALKIRIC
jgi:hypothetical protein